MKVYKPPYNHRFAAEILQSKGLYEEIINAVETVERFDSKLLESHFGKLEWTPQYRLSIKKETEKKWRYDAFKKGVALEIEKGGQAYRDFLKFMLGNNLGKVDVGVLICPYKESGTDGHPSSVTIRELNDLRNILSMPILVIGVLP